MHVSLKREIAVAALAHEGQVDKAGAPYILHSLRVMLLLRTTEERRRSQPLEDMRVRLLDFSRRLDRPQQERRRPRGPRVFELLKVCCPGKGEDDFCFHPQEQRQGFPQGTEEGH